MPVAFTQPLGVILAGKALESARVGEIFRDGYGCSEEIIPNVHSIMVAVQRGLGDGRDFSYSAGTGTSAYGDDKIPDADMVQVDLNKVWDHNVDLPATITTASPVELYDSTVRNIGRSVANYSNKSAIAECLLHNTVLAKGADVATTILNGLAKLEEGDATKNIYRFETEKAVIVCTPLKYAELLNKNLIIYKDAIAGEESANFKGYFNGSTKVFVVPSTMFGGKEAVLIVAPNAFAKGTSPAENLKVIDNPDGQGLRLQPLYRLGYKVANAKGVLLQKEA